MAVIESINLNGLALSHSVDKAPLDDDFVLHIHDNLEFFCLVRGSVDYVVEGSLYELEPGAILLMRAGETHKLVVKGKQEYERYVLNFDSSLVNQELLSPFVDRPLGERNLYLKQEFDISPVSFFKKIFKESALLGLDESNLISNLSALLLSVKLAFLSKERKEANESGINGIVSYINNNLTRDDLSAKEIAEHFHISPSQLNRNFKRVMGNTVYDYILSKRLILFNEKVKSGVPVVSASLDCGFNDYSSFYRLYKKRFGVCPSAI